MSPTAHVLSQAGVVALEFWRHEEEREVADCQVVSKGLVAGIWGLEPPLNHGRRPGTAGAGEVCMGALGCIERAIGEGPSGRDVDLNLIGAAWE